MNVKCTFLNGYIDEEVYVKQHPSFKDYEFPYSIFKLKKSLYGVKQALIIDTTLYIKSFKNDLFIVRVYVNDIIFSYTNGKICKSFQS